MLPVQYESLNSVLFAMTQFTVQSFSLTSLAFQIWTLLPNYE